MPLWSHDARRLGWVVRNPPLSCRILDRYRQSVSPLVRAPRAIGYSRRVSESIPQGQGSVPRPFNIPDDLHPDNVPLAFLLGRWEGHGKGDYPTIEPFDFGQEVVFSHNGKPFLYYTSRTWLLDEEGNAIKPLGMETGFWRPQPDRGVELVLAHPTGVAEIWYGQVDGAKIELTTDLVARTVSAKEYTAGHRLYGLVEGDLLWTFDMAAMGQDLQSHLWARLRRASMPASPGHSNDNSDD